MLTLTSRTFATQHTASMYEDALAQQALNSRLFRAPKIHLSSRRSRTSKMESHADPENIRKGIADALCYNEKASKNKRKGKDKWIGGSFPPPRYDPAHPRVIVIIKTYDPPEHIAPDMIVPSKRKKKKRKKSK